LALSMASYKLPLKTKYLKKGDELKWKLRN
jgi:ribosomal protein L16/L10AE